MLEKVVRRPWESRRASLMLRMASRQISHMVHSRIIRHIGVVSMLSLTAGIFGFVRDALIAVIFGVGPATDAYLATNIWLRFFIDDLPAILLPSAVPAYVALVAAGAIEQARAMIRQLLIWGIGAASVAAIAVVIFRDELSTLILPGLAPESRDLVSDLLGAVFMLGPFLVVISVLRIDMDARRLHSYPVIARIIYILFMTCGLLGLSSMLGIWGIVVGAYAGVAMAALVLFLRYSRNRQAKMAGSEHFKGHSGRVVFATVVSIATFYVLSRATAVFDRYLLSFELEGSISYLALANTLIGIPGMIISQPIAVVLLTRFSEIYAKGDWPGLRKLYLVSLFLVSLAGGLITFTYLSVPDLIISIVYHRGSFTAADVASMSPVLRALAPLVLIFMFLNILVALASTLKLYVLVPLFCGLGIAGKLAYLHVAGTTIDAVANSIVVQQGVLVAGLLAVISWRIARRS